MKTPAFAGVFFCKYFPNFAAMVLRIAQMEDLLWIVSVYNSTIASRLSTADLEPVSVESRTEWFLLHQKKNRPLWIAEEQNVKVGWISLSDFKAREAYHLTAEISVYLEEKYRGSGIGKSVLQEVIAQCGELGIRNLVAVIFAHNLPSIKLFADAGFSEWGHLPEIAEMDDKLYSVKVLGRKVSANGNR